MPSPIPLPPAERLRELLRRYGDVLVWKAREPSDFANPAVCNRWNSKNAGRPAGTKGPGPRRLRVEGRLYTLSRILRGMTQQS
jgi:hypothetical protein